jgi:hypothetical protein
MLMKAKELTVKAGMYEETKGVNADFWGEIGF